MSENQGGWQPSAELQEMMNLLTPNRTRAIRRIIEEVELGGQPMAALFRGKDKICNKVTWNKAKGWSHNKMFMHILGMAKREIRAASLGGISEAVRILQDASPIAARDLVRQTTGDEAAIQSLLSEIIRPITAADKDIDIEHDPRVAAVNSLAQIGTAAASLALLQALLKSKAHVRTAILTALGQAASGVSTQRRLAAVAILNRASEETADKGQGNAAGEYSDDELAQIIKS